MRKYEKHWVYYLYFYDHWMALSLLRYREGPQLDEPEDAAQRTMTSSGCSRPDSDSS